MRRISSVGVLASLLLVAGAVFIPAATAQGEGASDASSADSELMWSVRPTPKDDADTRPNFQYALDAGSTVRDSIRVRNHGDEELILAVYASDAVVTESGSLDLLPASERPTDVGTWVDLAADELAVPAGKFVDVPFTLSVPAMAESGDHSGGIVTSVLTRSEATGGQPVILDRRLGSRLQVRVAGELAPSLEISELEVDYRGTANPAGRGRLAVSYRVTNDGNVRMAADPVIEVRGPAGLPSQTAALERSAELLPGSSLTYTVEVPRIWPTLRPEVTLKLTPVATRSGDVFPGDLTFSRSTRVAAMPWTSLGVLVLAAAVSLWLRRRRIRLTPEATEALVSQEIDRSVPKVEAQSGVGADTSQVTP